MGGKFQFQSVKKSYLAGEPVKCWVYLKLASPVEVERPITFEVIGYGKSEWIVHPNSPFSTGDGKSRRVVAEDPFWSASVNLAEPKVFEKGEHAYQAVINLPSDLFPSFTFRDDPSGEEFSVRYVIRANLSSRDKGVEPLEKVIEIVSPRLDATTLDGLIVRDKTPSGTAVSISARRALWQPANTATCFYTISSPSNSTMTGVDLELWQKVGLPGPKGNTDRVGIRRMVASYSMPGLAAGQTRSSVLKLDIPVLPPTIQLGPIDISYELCTVAAFPMASREEFCISPIVLLPNIELSIPEGYDDLDEFANPNLPRPDVISISPTPLASSNSEPGSAYPSLPGTFPGSPNPNFSPALPWGAPFPPPSSFPFGAVPTSNGFFGGPPPPLGFLPSSPAMPPQMAGYPPSPGIGPQGPPGFQTPVLPSPGPSPAISPIPMLHAGPPATLPYQGPPTIPAMNFLPQGAGPHPPLLHGPETLAFGGVRPPLPTQRPISQGTSREDEGSAVDDTSSEYSAMRSSTVGSSATNGGFPGAADKRNSDEEKERSEEVQRAKEMQLAAENAQRQHQIAEQKRAAANELELQRISAEKEKLAKDKELFDQKLKLEKELEIAKREMENERMRHQLVAEMEKVRMQADELRRQQDESERARIETERLRKEIADLTKQKEQLAAAVVTSANSVTPISFANLAAVAASTPKAPAESIPQTSPAVGTPQAISADDSQGKKPRSRLAEQVALAMANIPNRTVTTIKRQSTLPPVVAAAVAEPSNSSAESSNNTTAAVQSISMAVTVDENAASGPSESIKPSLESSGAPPRTVTELEIKNAYEDSLDTYRARLLAFLSQNGYPAPGTQRRAIRSEEMRKAETVIGLSAKAEKIMDALKDSMKLVEKELVDAFEVAAFQSLTDRIKEGKIHLQNAIDAGVISTIQDLDAECYSFVESLKERTDPSLPGRIWDKALQYFEESARAPLIRRLDDRLGYLQEQLQQQLLKQQQYANNRPSIPPLTPRRPSPSEPLPAPSNPANPLTSLAASRRSDEPSSLNSLRHTAPIPAPPPGVVYQPPPPPSASKKTQFVKPAPVPITVTMPPRYAAAGQGIPPRPQGGGGGGGGFGEGAMLGLAVPENRKCLRTGCANNKAVGKAFCSSNCEVIYARQQAEAAARNRW